MAYILHSPLVTLSITMLYHDAECRYADSHVLFNVIPTVGMLSVIMLGVMAPLKMLLLT
jgi:hypothetical protein